MTFQNKIENNLRKMCVEVEFSKELFVETTYEQFEELKSLIGDSASKFMDFYKQKQPNQFPALKSGTMLLNVNGIIEENTELAPGMYLSKLGIYVFATTIGGNSICIDINDMKVGDPVVLIVDHTFCYGDDDEIEIVNLPSYIDERDIPDEDYEFNYVNVRKFVYKLEDSFTKFLENYSLNQYNDLEEFL